MDDLELELHEAELNDRSSDEARTRSTLLHVSHEKRRKFKGQVKESGFHKSARLCLLAIKDAILHHRWQEAAHYLEGYTQSLEDTTTAKQLVACEIIWRLGTEVLQHHPNTQLDHFNVLYERMKNTGVKNYAKICLEHAFHLLLNGHVDKAKQQLSVAQSWRYGKQSAGQSLEFKFIHAYCGFLDYLVWSAKRLSLSDTEDCGNSHEMYSYFRQSSVTLQEVIKQPGVWDPFVTACLDMLNFYSDEETALQLLQNYAYNTENPSNPNAHIYMYEYQKRNKASPAQLVSTLKVLHSLVPSHELMLEYCSLLQTSGEKNHLKQALGVAMDLVEYTCWKTNVRAWICLLKCLKCSKKTYGKKQFKKSIEEEWKPRREHWMKMHFKVFHCRKDSKENPQLLHVKVKVLQHLNLHHRRYNLNFYKEEKLTRKTKKGK